MQAAEDSAQKKHKSKPVKYTVIDYLHTASENINKTHIYLKSVKNITIFIELTYLSGLSHTFMLLQERSIRKGKKV